MSTQEAFGRLLTSLAGHERLAARVVTLSSDVSVSTNLGGWINEVGVYRPEEATVSTGLAKVSGIAGGRHPLGGTSSWGSRK